MTTQLGMQGMMEAANFRGRLTTDAFQFANFEGFVSSQTYSSASNLMTAGKVQMKVPTNVGNFRASGAEIFLANAAAVANNHSAATFVPTNQQTNAVPAGFNSSLCSYNGGMFVGGKKPPGPNKSRFNHTAAIFVPEDMQKKTLPAGPKTSRFNHSASIFFRENIQNKAAPAGPKTSRFNHSAAIFVPENKQNKAAPAGPQNNRGNHAESILVEKNTQNKADTAGHHSSHINQTAGVLVGENMPAGCKTRDFKHTAFFPVNMKNKHVETAPNLCNTTADLLVGENVQNQTAPAIPHSSLFNHSAEIFVPENKQNKAVPGGGFSVGNNIKNKLSPTSSSSSLVNHTASSFVPENVQNNGAPHSSYHTGGHLVGDSILKNTAPSASNNRRFNYTALTFVPEKLQNKGAPAGTYTGRFNHFESLLVGENMSTAPNTSRFGYTASTVVPSKMPNNVVTPPPTPDATQLPTPGAPLPVTCDNFNKTITSTTSSSKSLNSNDLNKKFIKHDVVIPNRIFVGGISGDTTVADLYRAFSAHGNVKSTKIIVDRNGANKGYGFVTFVSNEEAQRLQSNGFCVFLRDRILSIGPAVRKQLIASQQACDNVPKETDTAYDQMLSAFRPNTDDILSLYPKWSVKAD